MATTLTIRNVPPGLHARLKRRAKRHHRSLNSEVIHLLSQVLDEQVEEQADVVRRIRERRRQGPEYSMDPEELQRRMREGLQ